MSHRKLLGCPTGVPRAKRRTVVVTKGSVLFVGDVATPESNVEVTTIIHRCVPGQTSVNQGTLLVSGAGGLQDGVGAVTVVARHRVDAHSFFGVRSRHLKCEVTTSTLQSCQSMITLYWLSGVRP